jgi:thymidylate synthase ThyX
VETSGAPRFYDREGVPHCEWRGTSFRIVDVRGERFLMPLSVWERHEFRPGLMNALELSVRLFQEALERGVPFEDARYLLPEGSLSHLEFEGTI